MSEKDYDDLISGLTKKTEGIYYALNFGSITKYSLCLRLL